MTAGGVPHILIVDDEAEVLDVLREMVASLGYNVSTASNGAEALAAVLALQPDALMTDLAMPAMSGLELIARVKAARPQLPVIVTAAAIEPATIEDARARGAFEYISKPFDLQRLSDVLASALRRREQ